MSEHEVNEAGTLDRRRALLAAVPLAVGLTTGLGLAHPEVAAAVTNDVIHDQGGAVFNVKAYGAVGDGAADDTQKIRDALAAAAAAGGGTVYIPQGTYKVTGEIAFPGSGLHVTGAGQEATRILVASGYTGDVFTITTKSGTSVTRLTITAQAARTAGAAILIAGQASDLRPARAVVQDVNFDRQWVGTYVGDATSPVVGGNPGAWVLFFDRLTHTRQRAGAVGMWFNTTGGSHMISNVHMAGPAISGDGTNQPLAGLRMHRNAGYQILSVEVVQYQSGLLFDPPPGAIVSAGMHLNSLFDTCSNNGITMLGPGGDGWINQMYFTNCWTCNSQHGGNGCYIGGPGVDRIQFVNHKFYLNKNNGLWVHGGGATRVYVDASEASGNGFNRGANHLGAGFYFSESTLDFAVRNSRALGNYWDRQQPTLSQRYGIVIDSGCKFYLVSGNHLVGNTVTNLVDNGGAVLKLVTGNLV